MIFLHIACMISSFFAQAEELTDHTQTKNLNVATHARKNA